MGALLRPTAMITGTGSSGPPGQNFFLDFAAYLGQPTGGLNETMLTRLSSHNQLRALYEHVHRMRVVPLDLRSFGELVGYATGPFLPLLTLRQKLDTPPVRWLINHLSGT